MDFFEVREYSDETFEGKACGKEALRARSFFGCTFRSCRFMETDFTKSVFADVTFDHSELSLANLTDAAFKGVRFIECKLVGVDFTKCDRQFFELAFDNCLIDTCNFSGLKLKKAPFVHSTIRETRFVESVLSQADFSGSDLEGSVFHLCDLEKAVFTSARNYAIDPLANRLKAATFSLPEAVSLLQGLGISLT